MALAQKQHTLASNVFMEGTGLFMGESVSVAMKPAPVDHGIVFVRMDVTDSGAPVRIPALVSNVTKRARRTTLRRGPAAIETCEHLLSSLMGLGVDNVLIEVTGPELPRVDGSSLPYVEKIREAGIVEQDHERQVLTITEPITVQDRDTMVAALPADEPFMQVIYDLDYGPNNPIRKQLYAYNSSNGDYVKNIAPARTFVLEHEAAALRRAGMGTHLGPDDVLVIGEKGPLGKLGMRFEDEPVRHKVLDLIGDLALVGCHIRGRIVAYKSGHALNHQLARRLQRMMKSQRRNKLVSGEGVIDIRKIQKILPHRYPMLLIDRVVELYPDKKAVGIKNVTINEEFLQGHFPGTPIMPGVLIVEAMAQLSGILFASKLEQTGRLAVLISLDHVKIRHPVGPGDQLVIEAEAVRIKTRTGHTRCKAFVGPHLAAEAEIKFMLVDAQPE